MMAVLIDISPAGNSDNSNNLDNSSENIMPLVISNPTPLSGSPIAYGAAVPTSYTGKILKCTMYNGTGSPALVELYIVPSGLSADVTHKIIRRTLVVDETYNCPEAVGINMTALTQVYANGASVSFSFSYLQSPV